MGRLGARFEAACGEHLTELLAGSAHENTHVSMVGETEAGSANKPRYGENEHSSGPGTE